MKVRIFTDGACSGNPGEGGWACCLLLDDDCEKFSGGEDKTTNNRMELMAVIEGIKEVMKTKADCIEVHSDSAYVVNSINKGWLEKWKKNGWETTEGKVVKNRDLWIYLIHKMHVLEVQNKSISFHHIKGHNGNTFNEIVDKLAREEVKKIKEKKEGCKDAIL